MMMNYLLNLKSKNL